MLPWDPLYHFGDTSPCWKKPPPLRTKAEAGEVCGPPPPGYDNEHRSSRCGGKWLSALNVLLELQKVLPETQRTLVKCLCLLVIPRGAGELRRLESCTAGVREMWCPPDPHCSRWRCEHRAPACPLLDGAWCQRLGRARRGEGEGRRAACPDDPWPPPPHI